MNSASPNPNHSIFNREDLDDAAGKADKSWNFPLDTDKILSKRKCYLIVQRIPSSLAYLLFSNFLVYFSSVIFWRTNTQPYLCSLFPATLDLGIFEIISCLSFCLLLFALQTPFLVLLDFFLQWFALSVGSTWAGFPFSMFGLDNPLNCTSRPKICDADWAIKIL